MNKIIAIIGAGNMGQAIAKGLLEKKVITQNQLILTNSKTGNNKQAAEKADVIILAVKPQMANIILNEIKDAVGKQLIISIMAGVSIATIESILGQDKSIVRSMPNLAARTGNAMTGWIANGSVDLKQLEFTRNILQAIGQEVKVDKENQLNAVTAISGSGPAYFLYIAELLEEAGKKFGLSEEVSSKLATQTAMGTASLLQNSTMSPHDFINSVTSKGGTTEAAFSQFQENNFGEIFQKGVQAAEKRAEELNK